MSIDRMSVTLTCLDCRTPLPQSTLDAARGSNSLVCCPSCGVSFGHYLDVQRKARDYLCDRINAQIGESIKGSKIIRVK